MEMPNVLVVENHAVLRDRLQRLVAERFPEARVVSVDNGADAVALMDAVDPDLVFTDLRIPGMNGLQVARCFKERASRAVVVMLTNCDLPEYRDAARLAGADHFLVKSDVTEDQICSLVAEAATSPATAPA
jgi:DNA-binding NarL/FixJ family response regulator